MATLWLKVKRVKGQSIPSASYVVAPARRRQRHTCIGIAQILTCHPHTSTMELSASI
jgi:hypothetical protein